VDHARARQRIKRDGGNAAKPPENSPDPEELLILDQALTRLAQLDARAARVVELRYFVGLNNEETAAVMAISERTVKRDWSSAMAFLQAELGENKDRSK
jgi:RNA polymerase sigma factor (TIGR02999 family)